MLPTSEHHAHPCDTISWFALHFRSVSEQTSLRIVLWLLTQVRSERGGNSRVCIPCASTLLSAMWYTKGWTTRQRQNRSKCSEILFGEKNYLIFLREFTVQDIFVRDV